METVDPTQPSVLSNPVFRRPSLPDAFSGPVDLLLGVVVLGAGMMTIPHTVTALRHASPESAEAFTLRDLAYRNQDAAWTMAFLAIGLIGAGIMITRMPYRLNRCELLLRWSGIGESKLLAEYDRAQAGAGGRPA